MVKYVGIFLDDNLSSRSHRAGPFPVSHDESKTHSHVHD